MNQKKCPKCGESNPPEAVMCWACYTPLTAGVAGMSAAGGVAGGTAGPAPITLGADDEKAKTKVTPVQIGVIAVGLLLAIGFGAKSMMGGEATVPVDLPPSGPGTEAPVVQQQSAPPTGGSAPPSPGQPGPTSEELGFSIVSMPNSNGRTGVMGILIKQGSSAGSAVSMAKEARGQFTNANRFTLLQVFVFNNEQAARAFKEYQAKRRNQPLEPSDYAGLVPAWSGAVARVEFQGNTTRVANPSGNPSGWWRGLR